jgi:hypothetical protein
MNIALAGLLSVLVVLDGFLTHDCMVRGMKESNPLLVALDEKIGRDATIVLTRFIGLAGIAAIVLFDLHSDIYAWSFNFHDAVSFGFVVTCIIFGYVNYNSIRLLRAG